MSNTEAKCFTFYDYNKLSSEILETKKNQKMKKKKKLMKKHDAK